MTAQVDHAANGVDLSALRRSVDACLRSFLDGRTSDDGITAADALTSVLRDFLLAGGKRIRPVLCLLGWQATAGHTGEPPAEVVRVAAALEMFHAFALIHDDVMDRSDTRRGAPTAHRTFAAMHRKAHRLSCPTADDLGFGSAVLLGDLALIWSDELLHTAGLDPAALVALLRRFDAMRTELVRGQYLDLHTTGHLSDDVDTALKTIRYKTARYSYERPLQLGASMASGGDDGMSEALSGFAIPLGEAFQLRDDLLGVFGDPAVTGKSVLDDLREGKNTVLVALAMRAASADQRQVLTELLGRADLDDDGAERVRSVLTGTGARHEVEKMIEARRRQALDALRFLPCPPGVRAVLHRLAHFTTSRSS
ncbi:polyprenyl synthetase family protein [Nocardia sp. NRRL S-836]|uniref:polyprenyl synthetase family protein n=1 Tax=Nocardia sp. NRRL S-836 TaxID=1519492 RepID=UPI0006AFF25F|nr:polyprenyl synthetase family protein [Nocardia sp. NRRL S-836]KOV81012.1 hypothetical protein ADL03_30575 [Nocardia sp. NRRL S-836]